MLRPAQAAHDINSVQTEVVLQVFADRILILVTQLGKVGALIQASLPSNTPFNVDEDTADDETPPEHSPYPALPRPPASIALTPLLGASGDNPLLSLYASQIATLIWTTETGLGGGMGGMRPVVVSLALKDGGIEDPAVFHGIMGLVREVLDHA